MTGRKKFVLKWYNVAMIAIVIFALGLPAWFVNPRYFLDPKSAQYDAATGLLTFERATPGSRRFDLIDTYALFTGEAKLLTSPALTCPHPAGAIEIPFEVIDGPPPDIARVPAPWIAECVNGDDTVFKASLRVILEVNRGWLKGLRIKLPRRVPFQEVFPSRRHLDLEKRIEELEERIEDGGG